MRPDHPYDVDWLNFRTEILVDTMRINPDHQSMKLLEICFYAGADSMIHWQLENIHEDSDENKMLELHSHVESILKYLAAKK